MSRHTPFFACVLFVASCDCGGEIDEGCSNDSECLVGSLCTDAICIPLGDASPGDITLNGDGRAEIVAVGHDGGLKAFEFDGTNVTRIWTSALCDGAGGRVADNTTPSSGTAYENPVIADVDGDFQSEIVSAVNDYAAVLVCPVTDPLHPSTTYERNHGIVVLADTEDRWAASRPVWNQHAYAVTHVGDRGEIPQTSAVAINWTDPDLNNLRQNVQGDLESLGLADLTVAGEEGPLEVFCEGVDGRDATLPAQICNRGTLPLAAGTEIAFRLGAEDGAELCRTPVPVALTVGMCLEVSCTATLPSADRVDLYVVVDPDELETECWEGNNFARLADVRCVTID